MKPSSYTTIACVVGLALGAFIGSRFMSTAFAGPGLGGGGLTGGGQCMTGGACSLSSVTSTASSGSNGLAIGTTGARVDFGLGGADHAASDGGVVTFAGPITVSSLDGGMGLLTTAGVSTGTLVTTGAVIAGGVGSVTIGARHSSGYTAVWGNVTPSASNYMIGSSSGGALDINTASGTDITFNVNNSAVGIIDENGIKLAVGATKSRGTITMSAGTGTATVVAGAICTCQNTSGAGTVQCAVASTTLTATKGTAGDTDAISYLCL